MAAFMMAFSSMADATAGGGQAAGQHEQLQAEAQDMILESMCLLSGSLECMESSGQCANFFDTTSMMDVSTLSHNKTALEAQCHAKGFATDVIASNAFIPAGPHWFAVFFMLLYSLG